ncbi:MAG: hypothetical protein WCV69_02605 [Patescibacteria group bacterium]|jgi:hypothetical protein
MSDFEKLKSPDLDGIKPNSFATRLEDENLLERARELADFYTKEFQSLSLEVGPDEEVLVHFTSTKNLPSILGEQKTLANNSSFYDCDPSRLISQGFDYESFQEKFGSPNSLVAVPLKSFSQWTQTKSWVKLTDRGSLENAIVFIVPKKEIILRDHSHIERAFESELSGRSREYVYKNDQVPYYGSTDYYSSEHDLSGTMWEAWVPHAVKLIKYKIISHQSK